MTPMTGWRGHDPRNMLILPTETVVDIAATLKHTVLLTQSGKIFVGQYNGFDKGKLEEIDLECPVISVALYKEKIICVTEARSVLSYCHQTKEKKPWVLLEPRRTCSHGKEETGKAVKVKAVSAGVDHIVFLSTEDEIWVQGKGPALGLVTNKTENEITNPTRVDYFKGRKVLQAVAGSYFTMALVEALPPLDGNESKIDETDMDSFVKSCDMCRKETGNKVLYDDCEDIDKCPLGLGVQKDFNRTEFLSPAISSTCLDEGSSKNSINQDEMDSPFLPEEAQALPPDEVIESSQNSSMFSTDSARQFFSRPLSWVTSTDHDQFNAVAEKLKYKYPIDSATEMIRENVANAANLVRTVGDKVGQLSRHFSSTDCVDEPLRELSPEYPSILIEHVKPNCTLRKSGSFEGNTFPRLPRGSAQRKTHVRTSSGDPSANAQNHVFIQAKSCAEIEKNREKLIERGQEILNSEVWAWGSSNKGQLGLGDHMHQATPTNVKALNHAGIVKIVVGGHHTACLTIDGQIYVFGENFWRNCCENKTVPTPEQLTLPNCDIVRDMASGEDFLIVVTLNGSIMYIGNSGTNGSYVKNIQISSQTPKHFSVLCCCQSIVCTTTESSPKVDCFIREEVEYLCQLKAISQHIVGPLIAFDRNNKNLQNSPPTNVQLKINKSRELLYNSFVQITHLTVSAVENLWSEPKQDLTLSIPIMNLVEEMRVSYSDYVNLFCDTVALGGFPNSKETDNLIEASLSSMSCMNFADTNPTSVLTKVLSLPLEHVEKYEAFLYSWRMDLNERYLPLTLDCLKESHTHWKQLTFQTASSKEDADKTAAFWKNHPKLLEMVGAPSRRLVLHSKDVNINLQKGGRFFSNAFILLSDILVYNSYSSYVLYYLSTMWVESLQSQSPNTHSIHITVPEDSFSLVCSSQADKNKWLNALQDAIKKLVRVPGDSDSNYPLAPPLVRNASYSFQKHPQYKEATYAGQWLLGKMDGEGSLVWADGKRYIGQFRQNGYQGYGRLEEPSSSGMTVYEGVWKNGKLQGRGAIRYNNEDLYFGYLRDSKPHGHGELKKGNFSSKTASIYTGEFKNGFKHGYGVLDQINKGEKYYGMWQNNNRHGLGMIATMNDVYYEGNFHQNKLAGQGLVILEDGTYFEGEVGPGGSCNGKGTLSFPNGDTIEGIFSGGWQEGIKINGLLRKGISNPDSNQPKSFGKMSVPACKKWTLLFQQCEEHLGVLDGQYPTTSQAWNFVASFMEHERQVHLRSKGTAEPVDGIDKIFGLEQDLHQQLFEEIQLYLEKASSRIFHPIGHLVQSLVNAFRSTYGGVVSHPRLLTYAVKEVESFTSRLYKMVKFLFPMLPQEGSNIILECQDQSQEDIVITAASVIHPWILPQLYAPLSPLYVKHHERSDEEYWQRLLKWNKQSDIALMTFLGVEMRLWVVNGQLMESSEALSGIKDKHFVEAVETLQLLSTFFTPKDKLVLIYDCGLKIGQEVREKLGPKFHLSMDELLPIFLYVVVRSRIQHLGAEIGFIRDLMDKDVCNGKLEHMFTTLQACYSFILNENHTACK